MAKAKGIPSIFGLWAIKPGEYKIVAQRLYEIFRSAPKEKAAGKARRQTQ